MIVETKVTLFVYKGDRCAQLVKELYEILKSSSGKSRMRVVRARITSPEQFSAFLTYMEELYGSEYVDEYKRYGIRRLPALVVGESKVFEGYFPSRDELVELLAEAGILPRKHEARPVHEGVAREAVAAKSVKSCRNCVFYDASRSRCFLLHLNVQDPNNPPCTR